MAEKKNVLLHKRSVQQGVQPSGTTLDYGEIAVNYNVNDPFLSIRTTATGKTDQTYAKFIDESAINDKLSKKSDTSHTHSAYVKKEEFEDNELVVSQALNDLNEAISGVETSISDCVIAPVVDDIATTTMEKPWLIKTPGFVIGDENSLADNSGFVVANTGDGHLMTVPSVMFEKWLLSFGDTAGYIYYDSSDDKLKRYWSNGDHSMHFSFATEEWVEDQVRMEYVTYSQLKELRDNSQLVPGRQYRITDYVTTTTQANTQSAGHQFDVIVTADDNNTLNEIARAIHHQGDTYFSDSDLNAWQIWYCLDNDKVRFPWAKPICNKTITVMVDTEITVTGEYNGTYTHDGTTYHRWDVLFEGMLIALLTVSDSPTVGDTISAMVLISEGLFEAAPLPITQVQEASNEEGYGVIYRMIDEHNNDLPYDFKNIMFKHPIDNGEFVFTFDNLDIDSGTHYDHSLGEICYGNTIKKSKYGLNNIVFLNVMQEEYNNYCIGNIFGYECYNITFGYNAISNTFGDYCYDNTFDSKCNSNTFGSDCYGNTFGSDCRDNIFGNKCYGNTFGSDCYGNTFGSDCYENTFGGYCYRNTFECNCSYNEFAGFCADSIFGHECINNIFGTSCVCNTLGNSSGNINIGNSCHHNTVGNNCDNIYIGSDCYGNTFGNECYSIRFGSDNALISYCQFIIIDNGINNVNLNTTKSISNTKRLQNIHVSAGVSGEIGNSISINIDTVGQNYTIEVAKNSAGVIKQFCLADLIA